MAESKGKSDLVAKAPCVVYTDTSGRRVTVYEGAVIPRDGIDADHLKLLEEDGSVGTAD